MSRLVTLPVGQRPVKQVKDPRVRKSPAAVALLELPCACCGECRGAQLHHVVPTGQRGDDVIENLIALCVRCHDRLHHAPNATELYLAIGRRLSPANIAYVLAKKDAFWLERRYGVVASDG